MNFIKIIILLIAINITSFSSVAQNQVDTQKVFFTAKMLLLPYAYPDIFDYSDLMNYVAFKPATRVLNSKGFEKSQLFFFEIHAYPYIDTTTKIITKSGYEYCSYFSNIDYKFIFAYNSKLDRLYFFNDFTIDTYSQFRFDFKDICSSQKYVEGFDIDCLCKSSKKRIKRCIGRPQNIYDGKTW